MATQPETRKRALALVLFGVLLVGVQSHGSLTVPRSRNVINPIQGQAWWKDHGNGHGGTPAAAGPKPLNGPGVCGDPYQHNGDTSFYSRMTTTSQATYNAGSVINVQWWIQVNHGGRIGVKLCPSKSISQACFDQYPLFRADVPSERFVYIMSGQSMGTLGTMSANFKLPDGVSCSGGCVLQWEYLTSNSCFEPCNRNVCGVYADKVNPVTGQRNMGTCCLNCAAANVPEIFRNCADITINRGGPVPPPGGNVCDKCNIPVAQGGCKCDANCNCLPNNGGGSCGSTAQPGGQCGGNTCCPSGQCCSQWGYCGTTSGHCGGGCQRSFGMCTNARLARSARAGGLLDGASNSTGAPADVDLGIDGRPVSCSAASASVAAIAPGLEPTIVAAAVDPTAAPSSAVALEHGAVTAEAAAMADPAVAAAVGPQAVVPQAEASTIPAAASAGK